MRDGHAAGILAAVAAGLVLSMSFGKHDRTVRMRSMTGRAIRITSRIIFCICGLVSLLTAVPYAMLRGAELPRQSEWVIFVAILAVIGVFSVTVSLLPRGWIAKVCGRDRDDELLFALPLRLLLVFAAFSYFVAVFAHFAPQTWRLNPQLMFVLCPLYLVKMTFDPSPALIFLLLAPMNAAAYGSLGLTLGYASLALRSRSSH